ncbi:MAG: hypothetical protein HY692_06105 [Cyanobacteria bacterium NC_groundwater_1444_Ag_S-0.65um_54_12]|nr:hypothetical protein [Cyanobacteria bacterium NC_groundwater_1444_Ag_S-0.65um_54_12]
MNVTVNEQRLDAKVVALRKGYLPAEIKSYLDKNHDGYDSYFLQLGQRDFLVLGKGFDALLATDRLALDGQRGQVEFFEKETNTAGEGIKQALLSGSGAAKVSGGALIGYAGSLATLVAMGAKVAGPGKGKAKSLTSGMAAVSGFLASSGRIVGRRWAIAGVGAAVGGLLAIGATALWGAGKGKLSTTDDSVSSALAETPIGLKAVRRITTQASANSL